MSDDEAYHAGVEAMRAAVLRICENKSRSAQELAERNPGMEFYRGYAGGIESTQIEIEHMPAPTRKRS